MKKALTVLFATIMTFTLAACGNAASGSNNTEEASTEPEAGDTAQQAEAETEQKGRTIVVYYSGSGNTRRVAEITANELGADLFELVPVNPYSDADLNWRDRDSRVSREHDDTSLRDIELVSAKVPDWSAYDTVLIGYPIWWREAAWPVNNFILGNDFDGKTVIPFCTSTSSGLGDSGRLLAEMAGGGEWLKGIRFSENADESSVREWAAGLKP